MSISHISDNISPWVAEINLLDMFRVITILIKTSTNKYVFMNLHPFRIQKISGTTEIVLAMLDSNHSLISTGKG